MSSRRDDSRRTVRIDLIHEPWWSAAADGEQTNETDLKHDAAISPCGRLFSAEFEGLFQSVYDGAMITDMEGNILDVNVRLADFLGATREDLCDSHVLYHLADSGEELMHTIHNTLDRNRFILIQAYCNRHDGTRFPAEISVNTLDVAQGHYLCFFVRDTTLREEAEEARKEMELIINGSRAVAFKVRADQNLTFEFVSSNINQYGFEAEELCLRTFSMLHIIHPGDTERIRSEMMDKVLNEGGEFEQEFRIRTERGATHWVQSHTWIRCNPVSRVCHFHGILLDISEQKRMEKERQLMEVRLRQAQKMEAIGQLAAGIAHEINTPTQFVGDSVQFLKNSFSDIVTILEAYEALRHATTEGTSSGEALIRLTDCLEKADLPFLLEEIPRSLDRTLNGIRRINDIVHAMKDFSRLRDGEMEMVDINQALISTITVARNEWKYVADVEQDFSASLPLVRCLPSSINQVFLNILVNAAHAIADKNAGGENGKGKIGIRTRHYGDWIEISFRDTGTGIPESVQSKIFDPFFTTKEVGRGTGQGLAIAYDIVVNKHNGKITFETEIGRGTTFYVRLPMKTDPAENHV